MRQFVTLLFALHFCVPVDAQKGLPAAQIMNTAFLKAKKEGKNIMLIFTSTWCSPCKYLRYLINDPYNKQFFEDNYAVTELFDSEVGDKKALDNPGTADILAKYKGDPRFIPYIVILDTTGKILFADIDVPVNKEDIPAFIKILKKTSRLKPMELEMIADRIRQLSHNTEIFN